MESTESTSILKPGGQVKRKLKLHHTLYLLEKETEVYHAVCGRNTVPKASPSRTNPIPRKVIDMLRVWEHLAC